MEPAASWLFCHLVSQHLLGRSVGARESSCRVMADAWMGVFAGRSLLKGPSQEVGANLLEQGRDERVQPGAFS